MCPSVTLHNTNTIRTDLGLKPGLRADGERQATTRLNRGTALALRSVDFKIKHRSMDVSRREGWGKGCFS